MSYLSRAALSAAAIVACGLTLAGTTTSPDPHLDKVIVPGGCKSCHAGHGDSGSPMLPQPQSRVCLSCHESASRRDAQVRKGVLGPQARPQLFSDVLTSPYAHPIDGAAYSRREPGVVTCTSCHSPHRGIPRLATELRASRGSPKPSPRSATEQEFELCGGCHGGTGLARREGFEITGRLDPRNPSYHPVEAPTRERSASVERELVGGRINCTDCHGSNSPGGPRGPHGSAKRGLILAEYVLADGQEESLGTYTLCYQCHDRQAVLNSVSFPVHSQHVIDARISCASCHDAHGSPRNRALIHVGDDTPVAAATPSIQTGRLEFQSNGPGSGACYLTCHGYDHAPATYGGFSAIGSAPSQGGSPGLQQIPQLREDDD